VTNTPEYQRVREEIAGAVLKSFYPDIPKGLPKDGSELILLNLKCFRSADQILSIKGLAILADDQTLPDALYNGYDEGNLRYTEEAVKQDMLKANFKKVV